MIPHFEVGLHVRHVSRLTDDETSGSPVFLVDPFWMAKAKAKAKAKALVDS